MKCTPLVRNDTSPMPVATTAAVAIARDKRSQFIVDAVDAGNADRVGADAEIGGVTEAQHAAIAHDQIEAERGDGEDHNAGEQVDVDRAGRSAAAAAAPIASASNAEGDDQAAARRSRMASASLAGTGPAAGKTTRPP